MFVVSRWAAMLGSLLATGAGPAPYPPQPAPPAYSLAAQANISDVASAARLAELESNVATLQSQVNRQAASAGTRVVCRAPSPNAWLLGAYPSGWNVGYESAIVRPFFQANDLLTNLANGSYSWDYQYTPRVWLGYVGATGLGARARYWQFDHTSGDASRGIDQEDGNTLMIASNNRLRVYTIDLEVTQRSVWGRFLFNFAAGGRYSEFGTALNANLSGPGLTGTGFLGLNFAGGGPTLAVEAWRPLFGGFALYGNGRASLLYGNSTAIFESTNGNEAISRQFAQATLLPVVEMQLGAQWATMLGGATLFVRTGVEAQLWNNVGQVPNPFADNGGGGGSPELVEFVDMGNVGFFGVTATAGLAY